MNTRRLSGFSQVLLILAALPLLHAQTTVTLSTLPNPAKVGAPVMLTASVTPSTATGRVTFYDGVTVLGTKPLALGAASFSTILLPAGNRKLRAYYGGDATHAAATSNVVSQAVTSQPSATFATSILPSATSSLVAIADFNGDGHADLAVTDANGRLTIRLSDGLGNFPVTFNLATSHGLNGAAVGDFNGDGIPDLALITYLSDSNLLILLGNGDGTFQPPAGYPLPSSLYSVAVGDFNGDGKPDIAISDSANGVDILLGKGDGTFQPAVSYPRPAAVPKLLLCWWETSMAMARPISPPSTPVSVERAPS